MTKVRRYFEYLNTLPNKVIAAFYSLAVIASILTLNAPLTSAELTQKSAPSTVTSVSTTPTKTEVPPTPVQPVVTTPTPAPVAPTPQKIAPAPTYDRVSIPSIGLLSQMVTVGLTSTGNIDVNPSLVGWWSGSARPGSNGAAFLDGHTPGILKNLQHIAIGAPITVTYADGASYTYTVVYKEVVALENVDMSKALSVYGGATQGLNLMTCAGTYSAATGTTDQRLVVYATR